MHRRHFLLSAGATLALPTWGTARAALPPKGRVIIVGGGMAGSTLAKFLRLWDKRIEVTLVDRNAKYVSNIMSSLVLTGQRTLSGLTYGYDALQARGVKLVTEDVVSVDPVSAKVTLASGLVLQGDRVVLAPGIAFEAPAGGYDDQRMPHAWQAGPQTTLLAQQLAAMPAGGTAVLTIPPTPYRCPPGPYERACLIADWLRVNKPGSKLLVLDANADYVTERDNFSAAFTGIHGKVIEYHTSVRIDSVDASTMTLFTNGGAVKADVINLIPRQRAGKIVTDTGLATANEGRFAPVDVLTYASTAAPLVHLIGDSSATTQPKAGHIANQEAKICADALVRLFNGLAPDPAPVTNSACFSTITMREASWLTAVFQYDPAAKAMAAVAASSGASAGWNQDHFEDMETWFGALMADSFA
jgi:NADPH-dependent 2,4-dienoyl-CoA reductase/sulfur reductase-like enzyme